MSLISLKAAVILRNSNGILQSMIARLKGEIIDRHNNRIVLDVNGVGYEILLSELDYDQCLPDATTSLYIYHHIRENSQELFGFTEIGSKSLFEKLLSVSGVGPKVALSILSLGSDQQINSAISTGNIAFISGASGVGKKLAEKVVVELKDKVFAEVIESRVTTKPDDAQIALESLGYNAQQAAKALASVPNDLPDEERVKMALKEME